MLKMPMSEFKKKVLNKGVFREFLVTPYASIERHLAGVVIVSNRVSELTGLHIRNRKDPVALIIPYKRNAKDMEAIGEAMKLHYDAIARFIRVDAPFIGVWELKDETPLVMRRRPLVEVRKPV